MTTVSAYKEPSFNVPTFTIENAHTMRDVFRCCNCAMVKSYSSYLWTQKHFDKYACLQCKKRSGREGIVTEEPTCVCSLQ